MLPPALGLNLGDPVWAEPVLGKVRSPGLGVTGQLGPRARFLSKVPPHGPDLPGKVFPGGAKVQISQGGENTAPLGWRSCGQALASSYLRTPDSMHMEPLGFRRAILFTVNQGLGGWGNQQRAGAGTNLRQVTPRSSLMEPTLWLCNAHTSPSRPRVAQTAKRCWGR